MPAAEEVHKPKAEQPPVQPVKGKKLRMATKEKRPKTTKTSSHPPYFEMIKEALLETNEKSGSSPYAIAKYMEERHKAVLPANFRKTLGVQLKKSVTKGKLIKIKASYKLSESGNLDKVAAAAKKPAAAATTKKPRTAKAAAGTKRKRRGGVEESAAVPKMARAGHGSLSSGSTVGTRGPTVKGHPGHGLRTRY